jgi:hypothetical protein
MCRKIRCNGECEKFCKIVWKLNKALTNQHNIVAGVTMSNHALTCSLVSKAMAENNRSLIYCKRKNTT